MNKVELDKQRRQAYSEGYNSYPRMIVGVNPYPASSPLHDEWAIGRSEAKRAMYDEQFEEDE